MISTLTVGLVAALVANQIEASRPVVGPLEPRFRVGLETRDDGNYKNGFSLGEPLVIGHWVVLSLNKTRGGFCGGGWGAGEQNKRRASPALRRDEIGSASRDGFIACDLNTGRVVELIPPPPDRQPDHLTWIKSCCRAGADRCAVVIEQLQKTGPDTGKVLARSLWEWSLADNSLHPTGNWDAAALLRLFLDPHLVEVSIVGTDDNGVVTVEVGDMESGRKTRIALENPRPHEPDGCGEVASLGGDASIIPQPDRRSFVVYQPNFGTVELKDSDPKFVCFDTRSPNGRRWDLSTVDLQKRSGGESIWIFPIRGLSVESGLVAIGMTDSQAGGDHVVIVDGATGHIQSVTPLPKIDHDGTREVFIASPDGSSIAYVPEANSKHPTTLVMIDAKTGRVTRRPIADERHDLGNPFAIDAHRRVWMLGDNLIASLSAEGSPSVKRLFQLNPLITPNDGQLTAAGFRRPGDLESLTSLRLSRMEISAGMFGELSGLPRLTALHLDLAHELVGELKGLGACTSLRSLRVDGELIDPAFYREVGRLRDLRELDLRLGGYGVPRGALDELGKLTHLTALGVAGTFLGDTKLDALKALKNLRSLQLGFLPLDDKRLGVLGALPHLTRLSLDLDNTVTAAGVRVLRSLPKLDQLGLTVSQNSDLGVVVAEIAGCTQLKRLRLDPGNPFPRGALQKLGQLSELTELEVHGFAIDHGERPIGGLAECKNLTRLGLTNYSLKPADLQETSRLKNLKRFDHSDTTDGGMGLRGLFRMKGLEEFDDETRQHCSPGLTDEDLAGIEGLPNLKALALSGNAITDLGFPLIAELTQLRRLKLSRTYVTDRGLSVLKPLSHLAEMDLFDTEISDDGLKELAGFHSLTDLDLGMTEITDAGLAHLRRLPALKRLNLESTAISDAGLVQLWPLRNLRSLSLKRTAVTDAGLGELKNFPRLASLAIGR
jgi:Leucine-rich repeat (LRR) protein